MPILHAYFDDSSDDKHARFMAVGGLIGGPIQFDTLDILWASETHNLAEPFRSTECECQHGQFEEWSKGDCDDLMRRLVRVILDTKISGVGYVVPVQDYRSVFPDAGEYDPYFLALRQTFINIAYLASAKPSLGLAGDFDVNIICEGSTATSGQAKRIYEDLKSFDGWTWRKRFKSFGPGNKLLMPLQAADLIAREAYKHAVNLGIRGTRKPVKTLHNRLSFHLWTLPCLEYLRGHGGPNDLALLTNWGQGPIKPPPMHRFYGSTFDLT